MFEYVGKCIGRSCKTGSTTTAQVIACTKKLAGVYGELEGQHTCHNCGQVHRGALQERAQQQQIGWGLHQGLGTGSL
jgi:hypothetical protein